MNWLNIFTVFSFNNPSGERRDTRRKLVQPMKIISNAKTAEEMRADILKLIQKRIGKMIDLSKTVSSKRMVRNYENGASELNMLAQMIQDIELSQE